MKFGKLPYEPDARTLMLANFVDKRTLPPPPPHVAWQKNVPEWPMYANDELGNCTAAGIGHMFQAWTAAQGKEFRPSKAAIIDLYWDTGDGSRRDDTGRYMIDILKRVQKAGLSRRKIGPYMGIDPRDHNLVRQAIAWFGGAYLGFLVPPNCLADFAAGRIWDSGPAPMRAGHAVNAVGYDDNGHVTLVTWGRIVGATWRWWDQYVDECWVALPSSWRRRDPIKEFSYERLARELTALGKASLIPRDEEDEMEEAIEAGEEDKVKAEAKVKKDVAKAKSKAEATASQKEAKARPKEAKARPKQESTATATTLFPGGTTVQMTTSPQENPKAKAKPPAKG